MTVQLTLVSDRGAPPQAASHRSSPAQEQHNPDDSAWMHRSWLPRPRSYRGRLRYRAAGVLARAHTLLARRLKSERGAVTAEYVVVILAAVAFAALLVAIIRSDEIRQMLVDLVRNALSTAAE